MGYEFAAADGHHVGTFIKTPSVAVVEILGLAGLDFAVLDAEHAPLDRQALDLAMVAGRAVSLPLFVRIPDKAQATILSVLDMGATGLLVPHVDTAQDALDVLAHARYRGGDRGFSNSPRAGRYGQLNMSDMIAAGDATRVMCQIETATAVDNVRAIARVRGIDGLFIGRGDLALSMGLESPRDPRLDAAVAEIIAAGHEADIQVGMFVGNLAERDQFAARGVDWFVVGSDQALLRQGAAAIARPRAQA
jgi:2-keto-3-deoxy-L-rhamnonate aldolase RhmA